MCDLAAHVCVFFFCAFRLLSQGLASFKMNSINNLLQRKCNDVSDLLIQGSELIHVVKDLKMNLQILVDPKICLLEEEMGLLPSHNAGSSTRNDTSP